MKKILARLIGRATVLLLCTGMFINANAQTVTDVDGNVYKTVRIGNQVWMAENLKTAHYRDGAIIAESEDSAQWVNARAGDWCYYQSNVKNNPTYGKLYNGYAVTDPHHLCPTGWHVPSDGEWTLLTRYLGGDSIAGGKMKATTSWAIPNVGANNSSGFTALPAGGRYTFGKFLDLGDNAFFWSSTESGSDMAWVRNLSYNGSNIYRSKTTKRRNGLSVRCVED